MKRLLPVLALILGLMAFTGITETLAKYSQSATASGSAGIARPVINLRAVEVELNGAPVQDAEQDLILSDLKPGDQIAIHLSVDNYKGAFINQVKLRYKLEANFMPEVQTLPFTLDMAAEDLYPKDAEGWNLLSYGSPEEQHYELTLTWNASDTSPNYLFKRQDLPVKLISEQVDN